MITMMGFTVQRGLDISQASAYSQLSDAQRDKL